MRHPTAATGQSVATASDPFIEPPTGTGVPTRRSGRGPNHLGLCHSIVTQWREIVYHVDHDSANIPWSTLVVPYYAFVALLIVDARLRMAWWHPRRTSVQISLNTAMLVEGELPCKGASRRRHHQLANLLRRTVSFLFQYHMQFAPG
ncbi:hypothetical protein CORC01_09529 [Colletotrichum orchidophilum]|uniref:Uncharacterized protein n=1 Tax=Colletotrichum orchidophilum TaxID=1209926 RepID=A0A1G4B1G1_9PEZI|nr:uncharacterized protein CORC01_09529 [Colletotrichum orchidophilum]OHE95142.1 hypothetical protein CORC01_09529 [Colletotrichum orchidophilum]